MKRFSKADRQRHLARQRRLSRRRQKARYQASLTLRLPKGAHVIRVPYRLGLYDEKCRSQVIQLLAEVRHRVVTLRHSVCLDFRGTYKVHPEGALLLVAELRRLSHLKARATVMAARPPKDARVAQVFKQIGLRRLLRVRLKTQATYKDVVTWKATSGQEVLGERYEDVLGSYDRELGADSEALYLAMTEAMTNTRNHAYLDVRADQLGIDLSREKQEWSMFSQQKDGRLTLVYCDLGVGIPGSLPRKRPDLWQRLAAAVSGKSACRDSLAIQAAVQESVTRTSADYRGKGLRQIVQSTARNPHSRVAIFSNSGVFVRNGNTDALQDYEDSILGTLIFWQIPLNATV